MVCWALARCSLRAWVGFDEIEAWVEKNQGAEPLSQSLHPMSKQLKWMGRIGLSHQMASRNERSLRMDASPRRNPKNQWDEFFLVGTEPREYAAAEGQLDAQSFFLKMTKMNPQKTLLHHRMAQIKLRAKMDFWRDHPRQSEACPNQKRNQTRRKAWI